MLRLEDWMDIRSLHTTGPERERDRPPGGHRPQDGAEVSSPGAAGVPSASRSAWKIDPFRAYLRERWEQGVENASRLFREMQKRGYAGCITQVRNVVQPWRSEGQERAFVRFETAPGEQAQMDWGHFGNWAGRRLYGFALTLCWSRMQYVEFTQRQDAETLLNCMIHALHFFGGVHDDGADRQHEDRVLDRIDGQPRFHPKMLDFASYYGFVPRVCHPYRPETKGKIESTIRYIKSSFWPGIRFDSLSDLNRQALEWCDEANRRVHGTTREIPMERWSREELTPLGGHPDYDTGKSVLVREGLDTGSIRIFHQNDQVAEHRLANGKGAIAGVDENAAFAALISV